MPRAIPLYRYNRRSLWGNGCILVPHPLTYAEVIMKTCKKCKIEKPITEYKASKDNRTPAWADLDAIRAIYKDCAAINRVSSTRHEVDHIVPLRGELVSGLHVAHNLQIIPAVENSSKGNTWLT